MTLNRITSGEVLTPVTFQNISEIICAINALKQSKAAALPSSKLFLVTSVVFAELLLPLIRYSWESEILPNQWRKGITVEILVLNVVIGGVCMYTKCALNRVANVN